MSTNVNTIPYHQKLGMPRLGSLPVYEGKPLIYQELSLFAGLIPIMQEPIGDGRRPVIRFKGGKITHSTWNQILSFLLWTQQEFKGESQVRLFYHSDRKEWRVAVVPQYISASLSTNEIADHAERTVAFREAGEADGFFCFGTVHHHCTIGAFMSGTDENDERKQNGLHITVGHLDKPVLDLHARVSFRNVLYGVKWEEYFDFDPALLPVPPVAPAFPDVWKTRMIRRPAYTAPNNMYGQWKADSVWVPGQGWVGGGVRDEDWGCGGGWYSPRVTVTHGKHKKTKSTYTSMYTRPKKAGLTGKAKTECESCRGTGILFNSECPWCDGFGLVLARRGQGSVQTEEKSRLVLSAAEEKALPDEDKQEKDDNKRCHELHNDPAVVEMSIALDRQVVGFERADFLRPDNGLRELVKTAMAVRELIQNAKEDETSIMEFLTACSLKPKEVTDSVIDKGLEYSALTVG